jgi:pyruvate formate lyase activating enzyme
MAKERLSSAVACTYSEPVVWAEYVYDIAAVAKANGLHFLMVSNGFIQAQPMRELASVLSAIKIDLKAFTESFYREQCRGELRPVLDTIRLVARSKTWLEVVTLLIPGLNDRESDVRALARFVRDEAGVEVPLHFTRFSPAYRMVNVPSTPTSTLERARDAAIAEGLHFVYVGNVVGHPGNHTYCPGCKALVIKRSGLSLSDNRLIAGRCVNCGRTIPGLWV